MAHRLLPDLSYSPSHPLKSLDLFLPTTPSGKDTSSEGLVVFVHGGAWKAGSRKQHHSLPRLLPPGYTVALVDYRLAGTPQGGGGGFPDCVRDVAEALDWLHNWNGWEGEQKEKENVWLIGHSAGSHIISHLLCTDAVVQPPILTPTQEQLLRPTWKGFAFVDSIIDIPTLLEEYPDYGPWFINLAFGPPPYSSSSSLIPPSSLHPIPSLLLIHSKEDTLLTLGQTVDWAVTLEKLGFPKSSIKLEVDRVKGDHDELLETQAYGDVLGDWLKGR